MRGQAYSKPREIPLTPCFLWSFLINYSTGIADMKVSANPTVGSDNKIVRYLILTLLLVISAGSVAAAPFAYSVNSNGVDSATSDSLYKINLANGKTTRINKVRPNEKGINSDIEGLAFDKNGKLYAVDDADETLLTIDTASGLGTAINGNPFNLKLASNRNYDFGLTFTCEGALVMASDDNQTLYRLDKDLGDATAVGGGATLKAPITALAVWGDKLYGLGQGSNPNLYEIDADSGDATLVGALGNAAKTYVNGGLAFDADGILWALTDRFNINNKDFPSQILQIDTATGTATAVAETSIIGFESLAISPPNGCSLDDVPDRPAGIPTLGPVSILLMVLSLLFIGSLNIRTRS